MSKYRSQIFGMCSLRPFFGLLGLSLLFILFQLFSCTSGRAPIPTSKEDVALPSIPALQGEMASSYSPRPGLATSWGEAVESAVKYTTFDRENRSSPDHIVYAYYNDKPGLEAMLGSFQGARKQAFEVLNDSIRFGVTDESGRRSGKHFLPSLERGGKYYVQGEYNSPYGIYLENRSGSRIEVVVSVDGLDVIDGRPASFDKRGYVLNPGNMVVIKGFRTSMDEVAAFRFGTVAESYAQRKYGDARNVGVIGVAIFREKGSPLLQPESDEVKIREKATPFPGQFSTPP